MRLTSLLTVLLLTGALLSACSGDSAEPTDILQELMTDMTSQDAVSDVLSEDSIRGDSVSETTVELVADVAEEVIPAVDPGIRLRSQGWMAGDLHMHTTHSDGDDPVAVVIGLAEYLEDPVFLAAHPEYEGNPLDFIAITDHRTTEQIHDPDFHSDKLILIPGEEYGGPGHAGIWGLSEHISHDPGNDGTTLEDYIAGVASAHQQEALFSINHPFTPGIEFPWDIREHDALEVCNTRWALMGEAVGQDFVTQWEADHGVPVSPFFKKATQYLGTGGNQQAIKFYEAQLALGIHVALVGGSDRHFLLAVGYPTTWVKSQGDSVEGILAGITARHTFVSRTPVSATLEMTVTTADGEGEMGDELSVDPEGEDVTFTVTVGRARGGVLRLIQGSHVGSDEELEAAELGEIVFETDIDSAEYVATVTLPVVPGDWVYPLVLETLSPQDATPQQIAAAPVMAATAAGFGEDNYTPILEALWDYLDMNVVLSPQTCDPSLWIPGNAACMPVDNNGLATFFLPDWIDRALNVQMQDGVPTDQSMGAIGSAVMFL